MGSVLIVLQMCLAFSELYSACPILFESVVDSYDNKKIVSILLLLFAVWEFGFYIIFIQHE